MFRALVGMNSRARFNIVASDFVRRRFMYENDLIEFLTPSLIQTNPVSWGSTAITFLTKLVEAKQASEWPSTLRFMLALAKHSGATEKMETAFTPELDQDPRLSTLEQEIDSPLVRISSIIVEAMSGLAASENPQAFRDIAELAVRTRYASIMVLPLLVLYDAARGAIVQKGWQLEEIVRLLTDTRVATLESLEDVRRLLRKELTSFLGSSEHAEIAKSIRDAHQQDNIRIRELSDLQAWGVLTTAEVDEVSAAFAADEIDPATDPRTERLYMIDRNPPPERSEQQTAWPYPEDDALIRLLKQGKVDSDKEVGEKVLTSHLDQQLNALSAIIGRPEALGDIWLGHTLKWGHNAIQQLRRTIEKQDGSDNSEKLTKEQWLEALDKYAPWWRQITEAAIARLNSQLPDSHAKKELKNSHLSWMSGDPILHALELLDDVLAIDAKEPFDSLQTRFIETIISKWAEWPPFTRASVLSCMRPWFWFKFIELRTLLREILKLETHPTVLRYAVDRSVDIVLATPMPEIPDFVRRMSKGGHADSLQKISHALGQAVAFRLLPSPDEAVCALEAYFRECIDLNWPDNVALSDFLDGAIQGIIDTVQNSEALSNEDIRRPLLEEIEQIVARWPFSKLAADDHDRFPVHALMSLFKNQASANERAVLFAGLADTFVTILRSGDLPAFCSMHHELKGVITGSHRYLRDYGHVGLQMSETIEAVLPRLAMASVERVASWTREGKTTDDTGWFGGLDGRDSSELIKCFLDASRDKSRMKHLLRPTVDVLADAGKTRVSGELLAYIRKST